MKRGTFLIITILANFAFAESDFDIASRALNKSGGRIIRVIHGPDFLKVDNICSGALTEPNLIVSAAHCFYRTAAEQPIHKESYHFDIDGITSTELGNKINALKNGTSNPSRNSDLILGNSIGLAKKLMAEIPEIVSSDLHLGYIKSAREVTGTNSAPQPEFDLARSILSKPINTATLKLSTYIDGENTYVAGQGGMFLEGKFTTIQCQAGLPAYNYMVETVNSNTGRVPRGAKSRPKPTVDYTQFKLDRYLRFYQTAILNYCSDILVRGFSGGPQAVVRNGQVYLVGVTSQMFETEMGLAGRKIAGARVDKID